MDVVKHIKGRNIGRISLLRTVDTMETGEVWETSVDEVNLEDARVLCSRYGRRTGKRFSVIAPMEAGGRITITRNL